MINLYNKIKENKYIIIIKSIIKMKQLKTIIKFNNIMQH
jgi:hypothetical protein